jgi:hypothetical protein
MTDEDTAEKYYGLKSAFERRFGPVHEEVVEFPVELQVALLELSMDSDDLELSKARIEQRMAEAQESLHKLERLFSVS